MRVTNFQGRTVLTLESRRGQEMSRLIETYGGKPLHAPAMREVPLSSNLEALKFADTLLEGKLDVVIFLTGVGARALSKVLESVHPTEKFFEALRKVSVVARGPKPVAVLREWNVPIAIAAPEPNTWREVLRAIDDSKLDLRDKHVAVQEYGVSNPELLEGLREQGARVTPVPVYQWDLPEDKAPLRAAGELNNRARYRRGPLHLPTAPRPPSLKSPSWGGKPRDRDSGFRSTLHEEPAKFSFSRSRLRRPTNERYLKYKLRHSREGASATDC